MSEFARHLEDVLRRFGPIEIRRMFGGHGVFRDGLMFGLIYRDALYLKADAGNVAHFKKRALAQFEYLRKGRTARLSYYLAPDEALEGGTEAALWAQRSYEAALRSDAGGRRKRT